LPASERMKVCPMKVLETTDVVVVGTGNAACCAELAALEDDVGAPIPGLYTAGEMVGGLFHHNYPSGRGLTCGAVLGRAAGRSAADFAGS